MSNQPTATIPSERRRAIFRALVEAQDNGVGVATSRITVARQFAITEEEVIAIEREGMAKEWPPL